MESLTLVSNLVSLLRWELEDSDRLLSSACVVLVGAAHPSPLPGRPASSRNRACEGPALVSTSHAHCLCCQREPRILLREIISLHIGSMWT